VPGFYGVGVSPARTDEPRAARIGNDVGRIGCPGGLPGLHERRRHSDSRCDEQVDVFYVTPVAGSIHRQARASDQRKVSKRVGRRKGIHNFRPGLAAKPGTPPGGGLGRLVGRLNRAKFPSKSALGTSGTLQRGKAGPPALLILIFLLILLLIPIRQVENGV